MMLSKGTLMPFPQLMLRNDFPEKQTPTNLKDCNFFLFAKQTYIYYWRMLPVTVNNTNQLKLI